MAKLLFLGICVVLVLCLMPSDTVASYYGQQNRISRGSYGQNPCWYTYCPRGTTCTVRSYPCYTRPCPSYARCERVKEGYCPWASSIYSYFPCVNRCSLDFHCPDDEKCCRIGRCNRCVDAVDSRWDRTVTSESASERAEELADD